MRLSQARQPFDGAGWIFELKHDGFRALAYVEQGTCKLVSRNGHEFRGFKPLCEGIAGRLKLRDAILDGEICCLGKDGRSLFNVLLFRRALPYFYAFDLLWLNGRDLRQWPLFRRKEKLRSIVPELPSSILYTTHIDGKGVELFKAAWEHDLEGIVAKRRGSFYESDERSGAWIKIKDPQYSQIRGRHELFQRTARQSPRIR